MRLGKKILCGWLIFEVLTLPLALPAFAGLSKRINFSKPPQIITQELNQSAGETQFLVATNTAFAIASENAVTKMMITITYSGEIDGKSFGTKTAHIGPQDSCVMPKSFAKSRLFTSTGKTAKKRGNVMDQSVLITIEYDADTSPEFSIIPIEQINDGYALLAIPCEWASS